MTLSKPGTPAAGEKPDSGSGLLPKLLWALAIGMLIFSLYLVVQRVTRTQANAGVVAANAPLDLPQAPEQVHLPEFVGSGESGSVARRANLRTILPTRPREQAIAYRVEKGDSVFGIAQSFNLKPETVLWANYDILNDDPHMISVDQELMIPPTDGVLYKWKEGDTLEKVASTFKADIQNILLYPGNKLDLANPVVEPGTYLMIPGGSREFRTWVVPTIPRGPAGVNKSIYGPGACDTGAGGAFGTGTFVWPTIQRRLSGNDYWPGHLAIDIAAYTGDSVFASDSGVVVYAGPVGGGYGNMVMIDHGNGYQTLYAHLSGWSVRCGASVYQGQVVGQAGSTGRSTGPHLHFEVRYLGGFVNPWYVLP